MPLVHAAGISVRHAVARAIATTNRSPTEATWRLVEARVDVDTRGRVFRAQASVSVEDPHLRGPFPVGLVNPDGQHPLMAVVPGHPKVLLDIVPVPWERWVRLRPGLVPANLDPWCPRAGIELAEATAWAAAAGKRLPRVDELRAAWGDGAYPWGDRYDAQRGPPGPLRFGALAEVGLFPPNHGGFYDLGPSLWHWCEGGSLRGGAEGFAPGPPDAAPVVLRCAADVGDDVE